MGLERRGRADQGRREANPAGEEPTGGPEPKVKSFEIPKRLVYGAWEKVRANNGAPGVDAVSIAEFGDDERDNLYTLWNRMASGSFMPGSVRRWRYRRIMGRGSGRSGRPRSPHRARSSRSRPVSDSVVVTHPFHPLVGQHLLVILERRRPGAELVLVCEGGPAGRVTLPVGWTDRAPGALGHRLASEGLVELALLVSALDHPPVARRDRS